VPGVVDLAAAFDKLAKVKDACRSIALDEMNARKLGAFRET
jgi:hypothetical protein